jgi:PKD repeat protein
MRKVFTRTLRYFVLLVLALCCSYLSMASCTTTAQWTDTIPSGDSVVFSAVDTFSNVHHIWHFGDGSVDSASARPSHVYASAGVYTVCLYAYIPNTGCIDTLCRSILVGDTCGFTTAWTSIILGGDSVRFTASDTNSAATHLWRFSDGGYAFGVTDTVHTFPAQGIYTACFYVYRGTCRDSLCRPVTVSSDTCGILATWSYTNMHGDTVNFSATNTDTTTVTRRWNFGDGTIVSSRGDTSHVYAASGFYTACLYLHKRLTGCYDTICQSVAVGSNPCHINPAWTYYTHGGDSVRLTVSDTNHLAAYQWDFGDGNFVFGTKDTTYRYAAPGAYHICFYVSIPGNAACSDSFCNTVTVSSDTCGLTAAWSATSMGGDSLRFMAADTNHLALHTWNFGDGSPLVNTMDTTHRYDSAGTFNVCLYVHLPGTDCYDTLCHSVVSGTPPCTVTAAWTSYALGGDSMAFYVSDTTSAATHYWNFGDGAFAFGTTSTTHTYASAGTYNVCFYSYIAGTTCSDSLCRSVTIVTDTCHITSEWTYSVLGGDSAAFYAADTNGAAHHVWNFGDGSPTKDSTAAKHTFPAPGTYHVCLDVYKTGTACSDSLCQNVTVTVAAPCHITAAWTDTIVGNDSIKFVASDTNSAATHTWRFGDGTSLSGTTTTIHHYFSAGTYTVCFYSSVPGTACLDSLCQSVTVTGTIPCTNTAAWTDTITGNDSIRFISSDTNHLAQHTWNFGDGTFAYGTTNTIHHYHSAGTYTVCFYSYVPGTTCYDTLCQSVTVTGTIPCPVNPSWTYSIVGYDSVRFIAADTNSVATYLWDFGDGTTASGTKDTLHHYPVRGNYTVCFYATIPGNCADTLCQTVQAGAPCNITAAWTYNTYNYGDSISCIASDTNSAANHLWTMNGNNIVYGRQMDFTFLAAGAYDICLQVTITNTNCIDSFCQTVNISVGIPSISGQMPAITVMPNPFSQSTMIKVEGPIAPYQLNVYDLIGKVVRHESSDGNIFNFDRGNLSSGIYVYEVMLKGITVGKGKIVVE